MSDIIFRHLVFAKWVTVAQAAKKYGVCRRTVRIWLAEWPISVKLNGATYRISEPLLDLCVSDDPDERAAVADFLDGRHKRQPRTFESQRVLWRPVPVR